MIWSREIKKKTIDLDSDCRSLMKAWMERDVDDNVAVVDSVAAAEDDLLDDDEDWSEEENKEEAESNAEEIGLKRDNEHAKDEASDEVVRSNGRRNPVQCPWGGGEYVLFGEMSNGGEADPKLSEPDNGSTL